MKKLLLSMAMVLGMGAAASALTYTITPDMTSFTIGTYDNESKEQGKLYGDLVADGVKFPTVIYQNGSTTTVDGIKEQNNQMRWYKGMMLTIDAPTNFTIRQITFVFDSYNKAATFTSNCGGTVTPAANKNKDSKVIWSDATGVSQFSAVSSEGQIRAYQIIISDEVGELPPTPPTPEIEKVANIAAFVAKCAESNGPTLTIDAPVTVTYHNGRYLYLKDDSGVLAVYGDLDTKYENGDVIPAGITGIAQLYSQGVYQLSSPDKATFKEATKGEAVEPVEVSVGAISANLVSTYILLRNVNIAHKTELDENNQPQPVANNYIVSDEEGDEALLYNQFTNEKYYNVVEVTPGKGLNLYAIVTVYKGDVQLYPVNVADPAGVAAVELDENAPVEYFNLYGARVAEPANGLYIRRCGNKVEKVIVK